MSYLRIDKRSCALAFFALTILMLSSFLPSTSHARGVSYMGTDFWFGFMPNAKAPATTINLYLAAPSNATVTIDMYGGGSGEGEVAATKTIKLVGGVAQTVSLDVSAAETRRLESADYNAIHVSSTSPVAMYGYSFETASNGNSSDGFLVLPSEAYDTSYVTMNYLDDDFADGKSHFAGEFLVIAKEDGTNVTITTRAPTRKDFSGNTQGHDIGDTWTVTMKKGQTYLVQSRGTNSGVDDLSGSLIQSTKPVAVISGHERTAIENDFPNNSKSHLAEMLLPIRRTGSKYLIYPSQRKVGDYIRIMSESYATVGVKFYTGGVQYQLSPIGVIGSITSKSTVKTNETYLLGFGGGGGGTRYSVFDFSYSSGYNQDTAKGIRPSMMQLPAEGQWLSNYVFVTPQKAGTAGLTNVVTFYGRDAALRAIVLNGKSILTYKGIDSVIFQGQEPELPYTGYMAFRITLPDGLNYYNATSSVGTFGVTLSGYSSDEGYGMLGGTGLNLSSTETLKPKALITPINCGTYSVRVRDTVRGQINDSHLLTIALINDANDIRFAKPSTNYKLTFAKPFTPGDSAANITLTPIDPNKPGYAALYVQDLAGNDTVYEFTAGAISLGTSLPVSPFINIGASPLNNSVCKDLVITNTTAGNVQLTNATIVHKGKSTSNFSITPSTINKSLAPNESVTLSICFNAKDSSVVTDSLFIGTSCAPIGYAIQGTPSIPLINADDLQFGQVLIGTEVCKAAKIRNVGGADLVITAQDLPATDANFSIKDATFPMTIPAGQTAEITYCFHPQTAGQVSKRVTYTTNNDPAYPDAVKKFTQLVGSGTTDAVRPTVTAGASDLQIISLSPNPADNKAQISFAVKHNESVRIEVYDVLGGKVLDVAQLSSVAPGSYSQPIDFSGLANGSYTVRVQTSTGVASRSVVIRR